MVSMVTENIFADIMVSISTDSTADSIIEDFDTRVSLIIDFIIGFVITDSIIVDFTLGFTDLTTSINFTAFTDSIDSTKDLTDYAHSVTYITIRFCTSE